MDVSIDQLLNKLIEQQLRPDEVEGLSRLLNNDPEVVDAYLRLLGVHLDMSNHVAPVREFSASELEAIRAVDERLGKMLGPGVDPDALPLNESPARIAAKPPRWNAARVLPWSIAALATAAVFALLVWSPGSGPGGHNPSQAPHIAASKGEGRAAPDAASAVAMIIKKVDCDWQEDRWNIETSTEIVAGQQINLSRGMLVLEFASGPVVTLNGPTIFVPTSPTSAQLLEGSLSARVPPRGRGFRVETHAGDFVDLGTEFGLIVTQEGSVETHVFEGQVRAEPVSSGAHKAEILLEKGDAWTRDERGPTRVTASASPARFMRPLSEKPPRAEFGLASLDSKAVALWFDAAVGVQLDQQGSVYAWSNQASPRYGEPIDAWQVDAQKRPRWVEEGPSGRPVLRFDGFKGLVTEPLTLGGSTTSAVVFWVDRESPPRIVRQRTEFQHLGVQLLNLNGPPHTVLQVNDDLAFEARVHRGFLKDRIDPVDEGLLRTEAPLSDAMHVALYTYDGERGVAKLWVDGQAAGESFDAPALQSTSAPRFLGAHFEREGFGFTGDIAEILVLDEALADSDALAVSQWLLEKQGVKTDY